MACRLCREPLESMYESFTAYDGICAYCWWAIRQAIGGHENYDSSQENDRVGLLADFTSLYGNLSESSPSIRRRRTKNFRLGGYSQLNRPPTIETLIKHSKRHRSHYHRMTRKNLKEQAWHLLSAAKQMRRTGKFGGSPPQEILDALAIELEKIAMWCMRFSTKEDAIKYERRWTNECGERPNVNDIN